MWVWITLLPLKLQIWLLLWARSSLTFRQTIECRLTLKLARDMIITSGLYFSAFERKCVKFFKSFLRAQVSFPLDQSSKPSNINPLYFSNTSITSFDQKEPTEVHIFEIFECSDQNLSKFSCQFWNNKSIPLLVLHSSSLLWHINPL